MKSVLVLGAAGVDTNVYLGAKELDMSVEASFTSDVDCAGGSGTYSARGFARLGHPTRYFGYVGEDWAGRFLVEEMKSDGVDCQILIDPSGTRRSVNLMFEDGSRKSFYDAKAALDLHPSNSELNKALSSIDHVHFTIENWTRFALPLAKEAGATLSVDLQDVKSAADEYRRDYIQAADVIFFSTVNLPDWESYAQQILNIRPDAILVVGMGAAGSAVVTRDGCTRTPSYARLPINDSNGAGDSLAVGFLSGWLAGLSYEACADVGQKCAAKCCSIRGTSGGLLSREELLPDMIS